MANNFQCIPLRPVVNTRSWFGELSRVDLRIMIERMSVLIVCTLQKVFINNTAADLKSLGSVISLYLL